MDTQVCRLPDCEFNGEPQPLSSFSKHKNCRNGYSKTCRKCRNKKNRARYQIVREKKLAYMREYKAKNREKLLARRRELYHDPESGYKEASKAASKRWHAKNPNIQYEHNQKYYLKNKDKPGYKKMKCEQQKRRYRENPAVRMHVLVGGSIRKALKARGKTKGGSTFAHLPYTPQDLKEHIEKQFDEHMTWENHGTYWHVDHIRPHASFNYDNLTHPDFQKCWALENLRPLEATENLRKNSIYEGKRHYHNKD